MEIGETVEFIRHSKNISIKQVCGDYLTRQTYYRFIKNNLDISSKKLLYILDNLNVNVDEFLFISNNFKQYKEFIDMDTAKHYFECRNIEGLNHILDSYKDSKSTKEKNLFALVKVLLATLTEEDCLTERTYLSNYLINIIETWSHYETVLFNNCMFIFESCFIEMVFSKVILNLDKYNTLRYYGNESIRMFVNMLILFIQRQEYDKASEILAKIEDYQLNDDCLYERCCVSFFDGIIGLINGKEGAEQKCVQILEIFQLLNCKTIHHMFQTYLEAIKHKLS
ncbi:TPA: quorum-sensing system transcriptional regulator RopB/Rgg1 [Streptococcus pyogenes]|nr:quorum-sensing system transcriptional regulator RopB/Rgg1 [Streptococcus pyogenes]HEQ3098928.1 quorum-sensing system transcriptional regulator RopB/Rgg1 [Streptococcus pyogenes]HEQ3207236.1 quorum-sensing system transcriptional regulator RopB/Rgg1 [Streptococcus pyogenes]HEQ3208751.1 quorum-sensing system transcriptional regulator RopB/Rgg1 [Streptococcus pyogenes]HEQ3213455.1 quorum-sensing system transcriptional regulator RopB/Rgg1 [Streptococcus pyogenes]